MMCAYVVFTLVVGQVFLSGVPLNIICILCYLVAHPKVSYFHQTRSPAFDGIVCNVYCHRIVTMYLRLQLGVALIFEGELKYHALFTIQEEGAKFGFGGGCNN
jgi:hypothetical protein